MIALGKLEQFDPHSNFIAWMARIVRFTALNHGRKRKSTRLIDHHDADRARAINPDGDQEKTGRRTISGHGQVHDDQQVFDDRVLAALNTLDQTARACLLLRVIMNRPYRDIALALDIAEGTAMSHVHRSRTALRQLLSADSDTSSTRFGESHAAH